MAEPVEDIATLEADNSSEIDSDLDSVRSASITSSITGYKYENGRRYHAYREGAYFLPNDETEQARLDLTHHIFRLLLDGALSMVPLSQYPKLERCLDFGTGTGIWAIDFADEYPNAEVIGTDLSPIQPTWIPPNLRFLVDDVESTWDYGANGAFDYIHQRSLGGSIKDWTRLFQQIFGNLKPGGWAEMYAYQRQEYEGLVRSMADTSMNHCPNVKRLIQLVNEAAETFGRPINMAPKYKNLMEATNFVDIKEQIVQVPIGPWAKTQKMKEIGVCQREQFLDGMDVYAVGLFTRVLGWKLEEVKDLLEKANAEVRDPKNQLYICIHFVYGRKPNAGGANA